MKTTQEIVAKPRTVPEKERMDNLIRDIKAARDFLAKRFNAYKDEEHTPSGLLDPQTWRIEFPEPDKARVVKIFMGKEMEVTELELKLAWKSANIENIHYLYWIGDILIRKEFWGVENELEYFVGRAEGRP
jgi:hypothetical protein